MSNMEKLTEEEKAIIFLNSLTTSGSVKKKLINDYLKDLNMMRKIFEVVMFENVEDTRFIKTLDKILTDIDNASSYLNQFIKELT